MRYVLKSWPVCSPSSKEMKFILLFTLKKLAKTIRIWNLRKYSGAGAASANIFPARWSGRCSIPFFGRLSRPRRRALRIRRTCACSPIPKRSSESPGGGIRVRHLWRLAPREGWTRAIQRLATVGEGARGTRRRRCCARKRKRGWPSVGCM